MLAKTTDRDIPGFNCVINWVNRVLDLSSSAKAAQVYNAHPENEEINGFDKQTSLKLSSKKVIHLLYRLPQFW